MSIWFPFCCQVPSMAANPLNPKKRIISKSFHRILDTYNRQVWCGLGPFYSFLLLSTRVFLGFVTLVASSLQILLCCVLSDRQRDAAGQTVTSADALPGACAALLCGCVTPRCSLGRVLWPCS